MALQIHLKVSETISPELRGLAQRIAPERLTMVAGRAVAGYVREYLFSLDRSRPNKLGGKRTHFYGQVARSVQNPRQAGLGAIVSINHLGIRQRLEGGDIRPLKGKYLTIPAIAEAYGKRAREFQNLEFAITENGPALVERRASGVSRTKKGFRAGKEVGGRVYFWLVRKVHQDPDPTVLPSEDLMAASARKATGEFIERATKA